MWSKEIQELLYFMQYIVVQINDTKLFPPWPCLDCIPNRKMSNDKNNAQIDQHDLTLEQKINDYWEVYFNRK